MQAANQNNIHLTPPDRWICMHPQKTTKVPGWQLLAKNNQKKSYLEGELTPPPKSHSILKTARN